MDARGLRGGGHQPGPRGGGNPPRGNGESPEAIRARHDTPPASGRPHADASQSDGPTGACRRVQLSVQRVAVCDDDFEHGGDRWTLERALFTNDATVLDLSGTVAPVRGITVAFR